jgi:hypothetical protein
MALLAEPVSSASTGRCESYVALTKAKKLYAFRGAVERDLDGSSPSGVSHRPASVVRIAFDRTPT